MQLAINFEKVGCRYFRDTVLAGKATAAADQGRKLKLLLRVKEDLSIDFLGCEK